MQGKGVNLLPQEIQEQEEKGLTFRKVSVLCVLELVLLAVIVLGLYRYREQIGSQWQILDQEVLTQRSVINTEENRRLEGKFTVVKKKIGALGEYFEQRWHYATFLDGLTKALPAGLQMISLRQTETPSVFEFSGQADNVGQVNTFIDDLVQWDEVMSVSVTLLDYQIDKGRLIFNLAITRENI
ncbi:hypothetical protein KJ596_01065 [Patescibacteria group bacterium]|nr:hypothetical protein [Patescibacteria group bacterium]MBU1868109.1 hypothetical protein [Patescibacteria group bacterium]